MSTQLLYVELKSGFSDNGPAWIGRGAFTRSRRTVYFNGWALHKVKGNGVNHIDAETGSFYWVSGVKKDGTDRYKFGGGKIFINEELVGEYLKLRELQKLPHNYEVTRLDSESPKQRLNKIENSTI